LGPYGCRPGREVDKLGKVNFKIGIIDGPPALTNALAVIEAEVINQIDFGTHPIFIGNTANAGVLKEGRPLTHRYSIEFLKGTAPATDNPVK